MARLKDEDMDIGKIQLFVNKISEYFFTWGEEHRHMNLINPFDTMKSKIFASDGSIYLCFTCQQVLDRKEVEMQSFYQIKRVWHPCMGEMNGMTYPTVGLFTQWKKILNYIEDTKILETVKH